MFFYGLGYAILDSYYEVDRLGGLFGGESVVHLDAPSMDRLEEMLPEPIDRASGGSVFNSLKTAAGFGIRSVFTGSTGADGGKRDRDALVFQRGASASGVECFLRSKPGRTGRFFLINETGFHDNKVIVASPETASAVDADQFDTLLAAAADCILLSGQLFSNTSLAERVIAFCWQHKKPLALCVGTEYGASAVGEYFRSAMRLRQDGTRPRVPRLFVFGNEGEWAVLRSFKLVPGMFDHMVCLETKGRRGGILWEGGNGIEWTAKRLLTLCVNECGAGDVFAGAFLAEYLQQKGPQENKYARTTTQAVLESAASLAAGVCTVPLCRPARNYNTVHEASPQ